MSTAGPSLRDALQEALPEGFRGTLRYVNSLPKPWEPLFSPSVGQDPEKTLVASHFLAVSTTAIEGTKDPNGPPIYSAGREVIVLGIEVLVYATPRLTTIFVSKADSTGFMPQTPPKVPIKTIATTFLTWLTANLRRTRPRRRLVVSLFARSQAQYLFPGSSENGRKHVLDDRQLIKWWARVLDPLITQPSQTQSDQTERPSYQGYLTVPGFDRAELRHFYPTTSCTADGTPSWLPGHPLRDLASTRGVHSDTAPPRCLLPRFPDDPKARFMQELDDEVGLADDGPTNSPIKRRNGQWTNIRDLDRFWEAMEFRQECSSGRMVGFLWVVITPPGHDDNMNTMTESQDSVELSSQRSNTPTPTTTKSKTKRKRTPLTGPILPRKPHLKNSSHPTQATSEGLLLPSSAYDKALATLLNLDFASLDLAANSTAKWIRQVGSLCGVEDWGIEILGCRVPEAAREGGSREAAVNDLSAGMVRKKKRKVEDNGGSSGGNGGGADDPGDAPPAVNVLGAGMLRKKAKPVTS